MEEHYEKYKKVAEKTDMAQTNQKENLRKFKNKMTDLQKRQVQQDTATKEIKSAQMEDFQRRKELLSLNKADQMENFMRAKHFQNLYK